MDGGSARFGAAADRAAKWKVAGVLVGALTLRLAAIAQSASYPLAGDAYDYDRHAQAIAADHDYPPSLDGPDGGPTAFRAPLYPVFLAAVRVVAGSERAVQSARIAQALLGVAVVALIALLARQLWGNRAGMVALVIASVFPPLIVVGLALVSEVLFVALALGACAALLHHRQSSHRYRWAVAAGILCGLASLTRSVGPALVIPLALGLVAGREDGLRRAAAPVGALLLAAALTVAPWTVRNAIVMDSFVPVATQGGHTLAGGYNDSVGRLPPSAGAWVVPWQLGDFAHLDWRPRFRDAALQTKLAPGHTPRAWRTNLSEPELDRALRSAAVDYIADHPLQVVEKGALNAAALFGLRGVDRMRYSQEELAIESAWVRDAAAYGFYPVLALALIGAGTLQARRSPWWLWLVPLLLLTPVMIEPLTRFRAPIDPFLILLAALGVVAIHRRTTVMKGPPSPA